MEEWCGNGGVVGELSVMFISQFCRAGGGYDYQSTSGPCTGLISSQMQQLVPQY